MKIQKEHIISLKYLFIIIKTVQPNVLNAQLFMIAQAAQYLINGLKVNAIKWNVELVWNKVSLIVKIP